MHFHALILFLAATALSAPITEKRQLDQALKDVTAAIPVVGGGNPIGSLTSALGDLVNAIPGAKRDTDTNSAEKRQLDQALKDVTAAIPVVGGGNPIGSLTAALGDLVKAIPGAKRDVGVAEKRQLDQALKDVTTAIPGVGGGNPIGSLTAALGDLVKAIPRV
ncbi:hypothetical protein NpNSSI1_00003110 [Neofusicoccum parvum]|nr:hypothetical protein NpNSSI1_00003110 [Neofusicoccum parvum]